jgi:transaldolase/glucose-6-phosphate isomerase
LHALGQSFWYDNIHRGLFSSGELKRLIDEDGLRGMTSNPTIFEKAISSGAEYDAALRELAEKGLSAEQIYEELAIADIKAAADLFRPLYDRERGADGYVSLEVSPKLAHDTARTIADAQRLWMRVGRPNILIKVPATPEGIPAIEHLIGEGINVNVTLLFSMETYERVVEAYIRGLEKLAREERDFTRPASVASLFVSRVDTAVDKLLEEKGGPAELSGRAAIANSRLLYQRYKQVFHGPRFAALKARGARLQRLLWASTSTKNPNYRDVLYAEALIGEETVDTMPDATVAAFRDHGRVRATLEEGLDEARQTMQRLAEAGIDMAAVRHKLQDDGVKAFADSFDKLLATLEQKRGQLVVAPASRRPEEQATEKLASSMAERLFARDATLWKDDAPTGQKIRNRLGWLDSPGAMRGEVEAIRQFADGVKQAGFRHALLLGMGGSSLCPEVCRNTFGVAPGYPDLQVVDTTDPDEILAIERSIDLSHTLFINASKSGTTVESASLGAYFWGKARRGGQWIAITDAHSELDRQGTECGWRAVFRNPADIGGRYSALSYFGLVPAALIGADIGLLLERGLQALEANRPGVSSLQPPVSGLDGIHLGLEIGGLALAGRNKLTFVLSPEIADFGNWVEQLVAESTGKEGRGVLPVVGEPLGRPEVYGSDRVFVALLLEGKTSREIEARLAALEAAGHPVFRLFLKDQYDLGAEFVRWEIATAICGAVLKINPFDELNVTESKDNTARLLGQFKAEGRLPEEAGAGPEAISSLLAKARPGDYIAILAFLERKPDYIEGLELFRARLRDRTKLATTLGFGPRYLHSTGQLHKGGPNSGLFIFLTADNAEDAPIPGRPYSFGTLKRAQALGDLEALRRSGRRVVHIHLGRDVAAGLDRL